ncbi:ABC transporter ATP-binding protein [Georgenia sp. 311]|uniref:ABC transporter ATP-binding protein n=1 Tax=Georgenia wutianyii TaxID=2585135 RepID=A0ABX5VIW5_9MICO|nr:MULTISPECIES: ATP-binding cassette domain-containing protein [Georgenia]QDB78316.1 ABC transporter ATP-binding protein [Georgenia wutianyii]TNC20007.1 ABC transporter ATP-binding protein [Georgenia sp. 311]
MARLEFDHLNKAYGSLRALTDLTFSVDAGEIFGFVGSNGAGKTTAMRIALGVLSADSGEVRWQGRPLDLEMRRRVGYMPEERGLYPKMKVGEQLVYLARLHGMGAKDAVAAMEQWTERLGVAARRGDNVEKLSLGNQQRVQLAAALVHDPEILVLDEPFSGLDPVAVDVMSSVLVERAAAGVPVIFSSHQLDLVERLCDRVGIVRAGQMVALGTKEELRRTPNARWRAVVHGAAPGWARLVPGARVLSDDGREVVVELTGNTEGVEQPFLRAATAAGALREFSPVVPSLADLFRHVVSETQEKDAA